jgi:hypothetical protein
MAKAPRRPARAVDNRGVRSPRLRTKAVENRWGKPVDKPIRPLRRNASRLFVGFLTKPLRLSTQPVDKPADSFQITPFEALRYKHCKRFGENFASDFRLTCER